MTNLSRPRTSSLSDSNLNRSTYVNHQPDEVMELRRRIQELEREKEFNTRQKNESQPSAHSMQSQYRNYGNHGNGEQQPYRWNQQNSIYYPDTRFSETAYPMRNRTESFASQDSYKSRLPFFNERNNWSPRQQTEEIILVLKDEALTFAIELALEVRTSFMLFNSEMERRFGNNNFPETYRRELQTIKKQYKESIHEYAARIEGMFRKAYPGMDKQLFNNISIEYTLSGLPDQSLAYDVLTKRPKTMEETINLVTWHLTWHYSRDCPTKKNGKQQYKNSTDENSLEAGTVGQVSALVMKNEDAESADFDIDILFRESKMQNGKKEQEKDLSPLSPVRETKIVEVMSELTSEQSTSTAVMTPMMKTEKMDSRRQSSCVIQIDRVRSATINVPISINGQVTKAVLDTGAEVTVLNSSLYFGIPEEKRPILKKATRNLVVAEAGKSMGIHGIAMMNVKLGNHEFSWDMYIAPIGDSILLGCDIVDELVITIVFLDVIL
ncbi:unnamed protein product [Mytilus edulis]|uniref:Peptidase A2 domain-containing protein n=1 Tax=Mytilus edulis TaxID=6550 RepID=A0A8S3V0G5_MYTED|nr:unnamed protein product [Mytilus edulis]